MRCNQASVVAGAFQVSRLRGNLSFQRHAAVPSLAEREQDLWLTRAQLDRWSRRELCRHMVAARRAPPGEANQASVLLVVEADADLTAHIAVADAKASQPPAVTKNW